MYDLFSSCAPCIILLIHYRSLFLWAAGWTCCKQRHHSHGWIKVPFDLWHHCLKSTQTWLVHFQCQISLKSQSSHFVPNCCLKCVLGLPRGLILVGHAWNNWLFWIWRSSVFTLSPSWVNVLLSVWTPYPISKRGHLFGENSISLLISIMSLFGSLLTACDHRWG